MTTVLDLNSPYSSCELKRIKSIEFGIFEPEFLKRLSVCEITSTELYKDDRPNPCGLNDLRMGTTDYRIKCSTCNMGVKDCPGHFGHITLAKPMYHYGFMTTVLKVLRCICYNCGKLLVKNDDPRVLLLKNRTGAQKLHRMSELCASRMKCETNIKEGTSTKSTADDGSLVNGIGGSEPGSSAKLGSLKMGCGFPQPKYTKEGLNLIIQFRDKQKEMLEDAEEYIETKRPLSAEEALKILQKISDEDLKLLGFNPTRAKPSWLILTVLPVPPPPVRPYVQFGSDRSEDDLTLKLMDILKTNNQLKRQDDRGVAAHIIQEMCQLLQFHITTLFDNEIPGMPIASTRSKKPIKAIRARLKGKEGRLRGNLMGKRVDFSARTVITGDPNIPIDTIGVPKSIAMTLTFPEIVTPLNYAVLKKKVEKGPHEWPGAKYVVRDDGTKYDLRYVRNLQEIPLEYGYKVERHMQDGDYILFNRQPSLHKMSIMGHKAKILPYSTFRLNLSVTTPYNADFDGDEMNLHLAQTHEARSEIKHLMLSPKQIVSPQGNKPVMGIVQDSLLGVSKFTQKDTFLTRDFLMNLLTWIPYWDGRLPHPCIFYPQRLWTGKQVISILLSFDQAHLQHQININLQRFSGVSSQNTPLKSLERYDNEMTIRQNEHLTGTICKRTVGSSSGSLIHILWHEAGPERTRDFITTLQKVINNWLIHNGFTVSCSDILTSDSTLAKVSESLESSKDRVQQLVSLAQKGRLECQPGKSLFESFEARVNKELNEARELSGRIVAESLDERNNILAMVNAGSKGSTINISQIIACVGQQNVEGKRIPFGFCDRSLPHFIKHDYGPESRGFVSNSYLSGLTPQEMFFHAMGGREGIIDTACKTSETGYIQRRLIKAMEDIMVHYDGTVRNSNGDILQFLYGEDGMNAEFIEDQQIELLELDNNQLSSMFYHDFKDPNYGNGWILDDEIREAILTDYTRQMILIDEFKQLLEMKTLLCREVFIDGSSRQHLPINIKRLLEYAKTQFSSSTESRKGMDPVEIAQRVKQLLNEKLIVIHQCNASDYLSVEAQTNATLLIKAHLIPALNSRRLMEKERIGLVAFDWLIGEIERHFNLSLVHAGECVGAIAAQSIGEPATQMTLNTFHFAGVGSKNVTLGVPRLKELINVVSNVRTPSLTVHLEDSVARDQERAKDVQLQLEHTTLGHVVSFAQIIYDPRVTETIVSQDKQWVSDYYEFPDDEVSLSSLGPWLLRIQLSNKIMTDKKLTMKEVGESIYKEFSHDELDVIWTDDNSEELVLRIRLKVASQSSDDGEDVFLQKLMSQYLSNVTLRGIPNITKVYMREESSTTYNETKGKFERCNKWVLDTDGCNLEQVLPIPLVNYSLTISNDITEIFNVLGIEAARRALLRELRSVISFDGSYVNYRHLALLCDVMTQKGYLMSITRHGINRVDRRGPLMKCSFEETLEILLDAATFATSDELLGVTENVMMGQLCPLGTGCFDVMIDPEKLKDANQNIHLSTTGLEYSDLSSNINSQTMSQSSPDAFASPFIASPGQIASPSQAALMLSPLQVTMDPSEMGDRQGLDTRALGGTFSPVCQSPTSPTSPMSPFSPMSPSSPQMNVLSPGFSPTSPTMHRPYSPLSPVFEPTSVYTPAYSPTSPQINLTSPNAGMGGYSPSYKAPYSVTSPEYSPTSPQINLASPTAAMGGYSPSFSAVSPRFSPTSPGAYAEPGAVPLSPSSPSYPMSLVYDIVSPIGPLSPETNKQSDDPFDL